MNKRLLHTNIKHFVTNKHRKTMMMTTPPPPPPHLTDDERSLFWAVKWDDRNVAERLLNDHVSPNAKITCAEDVIFSPHEETSLYEFFNWKEQTQLLGQTPMHFVRSIPMIRLLVSKGADVNAVDDNNATPLFYVVHSIFPLYVAFELLHSNANPNVQLSHNGDTILHILGKRAVWKRRFEMMVNFGALVFIKNESGETSLDNARKELKSTNEMVPDIRDSMRKTIEPSVKYLEDVSIRICLRRRYINERLNPLTIDLISKSLHEMMG